MTKNGKPAFAPRKHDSAEITGYEFPADSIDEVAEDPDAMRGKPPSWTQLVEPGHIIDTSPLPFTQRVLPRTL